MYSISKTDPSEFIRFFETTFNSFRGHMYSFLRLYEILKKQYAQFIRWHIYWPLDAIQAFIWHAVLCILRSSLYDMQFFASYVVLYMTCSSLHLTQFFIWHAVLCILRSSLWHVVLCSLRSSLYDMQVFASYAVLYITCSSFHHIYSFFKRQMIILRHLGYQKVLQMTSNCVIKTPPA